MIPGIGRFRPTLLVAIVALTVSHVARAQGTDSAQIARADSAQIALLRRLYGQFGAEGMSRTYGPGGISFSDQPRRVMLQYVVPKLADLLLRDQRCEDQTHAICNLDFAPLWGSQDPEAVAVSFRVVPRARNLVAARIRSRQGQTTTVVYEFARSSVGWRIADIHNADVPSLRALLSRPL